MILMAILGDRAYTHACFTEKETEALGGGRNFRLDSSILRVSDFRACLHLPSAASASRLLSYCCFLFLFFESWKLSDRNKSKETSGASPRVPTLQPQGYTWDLQHGMLSCRVENPPDTPGYITPGLEPSGGTEAPLSGGLEHVPFSFTGFDHSPRQLLPFPAEELGRRSSVFSPREVPPPFLRGEKMVSPQRKAEKREEPSETERLLPPESSVAGRHYLPRGSQSSSHSVSACIHQFLWEEAAISLIQTNVLWFLCARLSCTLVLDYRQQSGVSWLLSNEARASWSDRRNRVCNPDRGSS